MLEFTKNKSFYSLLSEVKKTSKLLAERGWAEANAGNFSINITGLFKKADIKFEKDNCFKTKKVYKNLRYNIILVSSSGSKMRDISENPFHGICILHFNKNGDEYCNFSLDCKVNKNPTSELLTHLEIHNHLSKTNAYEKVVLHTHPAEVIALTHIRKFCNEKSFNNLLFSIQPEVSYIFPEGIGIVPYYKTGSMKLALETGKKFINHKLVLWEKHGCVTSGKNFYEAFDRIDVLVKSLKIYFMCKSTGNNPEGISVYNIKELKN